MGEDLNDILTTRVDKIPSRLARWLVLNFDTCRRAVKLASNEELRISEEDVYLTMGFPRGSKPIQEDKKSDKGEYTRVLDEWKAQWVGALPKTHQVLSHMKNQRQGGDMFKRNFIVYVVITLVKGQQMWKACVQRISRSLKNFARFVIEVADAVSEAQ
ncbi:hypothetical protein Cgig2_018076 [Carnegiea gigantea]|uniref:Uncharacterized protein n=1 Tax=Carnegiea gigantea TaxID=171969 RepID=A0A9Q1JGR3_9CARY|nr:hypothetical protein Cgig2_018076 [Carnegiea gigantea]